MQLTTYDSRKTRLPPFFSGSDNVELHPMNSPSSFVGSSRRGSLSSTVSRASNTYSRTTPPSADEVVKNEFQRMLPTFKIQE